MPHTKTLLGTMAAGLTGLIGGAWWLLRRPLPPTDGSLMLEGLIDDVEIIRDPWGIPHIYARTAHDLFYAQGFVHAQDRLWQMDFQRRLVAGRLSEVFGKATLNIDPWMRTLGLRRNAEANLGTTSDEVCRALTAYAKGVNRYIETAPALPIEFTLLHYEPEPWTPADSLSWTKLLAFGLSANWDSEIIRAQLVSRLGPERASQLEGGYRADNPVIVPDIDYSSLDDSALRRQVADHFPGAMGASNSWVVDGTRSNTGKPLIANDPHLPMRIPGIWYENHLVGGGYEVAGASLPGIPAVLIGHNDRIAWGLTAGLADTQDLYIERFHPEDPHQYQVNGTWHRADVFQEKIRIRGQRTPLVKEVIVTRHGPIITELAPGETQPLALRWSGYDHDDTNLDCLLKLNRARTWDDTLEALRHLGGLVLNVTYADVDGNIGYQFAGRIPIRRQGDGCLPVPGWTDEYEWIDYIPLDQLPRTYNPTHGFVVTANNKPVRDDYPHHLGNGWRPGYRARRITELIQARRQHDRTSFEAIQRDQFSLPMQRLAQQLAELALDDSRLQMAQTELTHWNGIMDATSTGALIAYTAMSHLRYALFGEELGPLTDAYLGRGFHRLLYPISGMAAKNIEVTLNILENPDHPWLNGRSLEDVLAGSLRSAMAQLTEDLGQDLKNWRWGDVNRLHFVHPLGTVRPLGTIWNRGPYPAGGDPFTVWPNSGRFDPQFKDFISASCRLIMDPADWSNSVAICPPGQSGHPASPHYADQIAEWRAGHYHPMLWRRDAIETTAESKLMLISIAQQ